MNVYIRHLILPGGASVEESQEHYCCARKNSNCRQDDGQLRLMTDLGACGVALDNAK